MTSNLRFKYPAVVADMLPRLYEPAEWEDRRRELVQALRLPHGRDRDERLDLVIASMCLDRGWSVAVPTPGGVKIIHSSDGCLKVSRAA